MDNTIIKDIWENGVLIPFDKRGCRMPMNKRSRLDCYIEGGIPEYLLVIIPAHKQNHKGAFYMNQTTIVDSSNPCDYDTALMLCGSFVDDWMPHLLIGNSINRVDSVELQCEQNVLPVVVEGHIGSLKHMADSGMILRHYIFRLDNWYRSSWNTCISTDRKNIMQLKFRPTTQYTKKEAIENIQNWFRNLLGLQNPVIEKLRKDIYSSFGLPADPDSLYPTATATYNRLIAGLKELDGEKIHPKFEVQRSGDPDTLAAMDAFRCLKMFKENNMLPGIKKVIFNKPCTIVLWEDGTKTIVRAQGKARFDREKGLAMCIAKKALENKGNYYDEFRKWMK